MLKLGGKVTLIHSTGLSERPSLLSVTSNASLPLVLRVQKAFLARQAPVPTGFAHYLLLGKLQTQSNVIPEGTSYTVLPEDFDYLSDGDVVRLDRERNSIRVLFRAASPHNSILVTEQCNHYCLMCSQPPKNIDDSWILDEIEALIPLIPKETAEIGFTGGEPTLLGDRFLKILHLAKSYLPRTAIHTLSNGRTFSDFAFAQRYAEIDHPDMMVGIPLYADDPTLHDYIVQAEGAFDESLRGILNLKRLNQKVEIRVVLHKQSVPRLKQLCEFLGRNLLFVDHVALMGMEMMGFARANLDALWIDPFEYRDTLSEAVGILSAYGLNVSIYNHPLCLVKPDVLPFYQKSISDWKNEYVPECDGCLRKSECGGFFSSGVRYGYSKHITPFSGTSSAAE